MKRWLLFASLICGFSANVLADDTDRIQVGAAAVQMEADDAMVIAGGIGPGRARGQEGQLRATAFIVYKPPAAKVAIVSCDVLMLTRDLLDPVVAEIEKDCGIPGSHVLIHSTHTHHAPSTIRVHGYGRDETFCRRVQRAIVEAVSKANARLAEAVFCFQAAKEPTVGQNSRLLLEDEVWTGLHSYAEPGTGERMVDEAVRMLQDLAAK